MFEQFLDPPVEYSVVPFWFLNERLETGRLRWQLGQMVRQGVYGAVMHARPGLITPYLSDEWFDRIGDIVAEAERLGMFVWIYDEYPWHSGMAEWRVPRLHPDFQIRALDKVQLEVEGPTRVEWDLIEAITKAAGDDAVVDPAGSACGGRKIVAVQAVPVDAGGAAAGPVAAAGAAGRVDVITAAGPIIDLSDLVRVDDGASLVWDAPAGRYLVICAFERLRHNPYGDKFGRFPVTDLMNPDAVRAFLRLTHDEYARRFPHAMGGVIKAVFTDEPPSATPGWSRVLLDEFKRRKGYDLAKCVPWLWIDGGPETGKVRYDYYDVVGALYEEHYFGQIESWCERRGLRPVGHVLLEETLPFHARFMGSYFRSMRRQWAPGIDYIFPGRIPAVVPKLAASAAHLYGKERVLSECFALTGWAFTFQHMKWMTDWQLVHGVNLLVPHAFFYAITEDAPIPKIPDDLGFRWYDCPPSMFFQQPYWPFYKTYADYARRSCYALCQGEHVARLAVYYPIGSVFAEFVPDKQALNLHFTEIPGTWMTADYLWDGPPPAQIDAHFRYVCDQLRDRGFDYDIYDDDATLRPDVEAIVLPYAKWLRVEVYRRIERFWERGGRVIATGSLPERALDGPECDGEILRITRRIFGSDRGVHFPLPGESFFAHLKALGLHDVEAECDSIYVMRRRVEGRDVYYLVHHAPHSLRRARVRLRASGAPVRWDPLTGASSPVWEWRPDGEWVELRLDLEPYDARFISFDPSRKAARIEWEPLPPADGAHGSAAYEVLEVLDVREEGDALRVVLGARADSMDEARTRSEEPVASLSASPASDSVPVSIQVSVPVRGVDGNGGHFAGTVHFDGESTIVSPRGPWRVRLHRGDEAPERLRDLPPEPRWEKIEKERAVETLVPWEEIGLEAFSGLATYEAEFVLPDPESDPDALSARVFLDLGEVGITAEVEVNGHVIGRRLWPPYRFEIGRFTREGVNRLRVTVANTLANSIQASYRGRGPHAHFASFPEGSLRSGLIGPVRILVAPTQMIELGRAPDRTD